MDILSNNIKKIFLNEFYYSIYILFLFLCTTNIFLSKIYSLLIYTIPFWGIILLFQYKLNDLKYKFRSEPLLTIFIILNIITVLLNKKNMLADCFVFVNSCIYIFFLYMNKKDLSKTQIHKEVKIINIILLMWATVHSVIALVTFYANISVPYITASGIMAYGGISIRAGEFVQLAGISGVTNLGQLCMLGILSANILLFMYKSWKLRALFGISYLINLWSLSLTNNLASIFSLCGGIMVLCCLIIYRKIQKIKSCQVASAITSALSSACVGIAFLFIIINSPQLMHYQAHIVDGNVDIEQSQEDFNEIIDSDSIKDIDDELLSTQRDVVGAFSNATGRYEIWEKGFNMWRKKPLFGYGYKNISVTMDSGKVVPGMHNGFLDILVSNGIIALLMIVIFLLKRISTMVIQFIKYFSYNGLIIGMFAMMIACIVYNLVQSALILERSVIVFVLWTYLGYLYNLCKLESKEKESGKIE